MQHFYSVDQVAGLLGLHVKTVRAYVREGRLRATRIGKQYRIAREDLEAFTGAPVTPSPAVRRPRHAEASSIVQIDAIGPDEASRLTNAVMATVGGRHGGRGRVRAGNGESGRGPEGGLGREGAEDRTGAGDRIRVEDRIRAETVYDEERASLKVVVLGGLSVTADLLKVVDALTREAE
ncbi:helix-turn-helix domain-containing protein [Streptomyces sp. NPDC058657]|uniref:helix-turn-helix domain-containing protein n=1 Tax=unclassified Streptomyces TaxID=2593676 RepID=UPI00365AEE40